MKTHLCLAILSFLLCASAALAADPDASAVRLTGTYVLIEHYKGVRAAERIAFQPDNHCLMDIDGKAAVTGTYDARADNTIAIYPGDHSGELDYQFKQGNITLTLSRDNQDDLYYGLLPDHPPAISFKDVVGIVTFHDDWGDAATQITPDHHFSALMRDLSTPPEGGIFSGLTDFITGQKRTYVDVTADGTCSYDAGVIHYTVEHTKSPQPDQSLNDIVTKVDSTGIWIIDINRDQVICQPWSKTLDLPAPPAGYTQSNQ
jgi:hypothetical protein